MISIVSRFALVAMAAFLATTAASQAQSGADCARKEAISSLQQAAQGSGAAIEPIHLHNGLAIMVTADSATAVPSLYKAADAYVEARDKYVAGQPKRPCEPVWFAVARKKLSEHVEKTAKGFLVVYSSNDKAVVRQVQASDCCNWCVCSSQTTFNTCKKCCG